MSNLIKTTLKELNEDLNSIQAKKREISKKYDFQSRFKIFQEIKKLKQRTTDSVSTFYKSKILLILT
jgi:hypothetical protein